MWHTHREWWGWVELTRWCVASAEVESGKPTVNYRNHPKVVLASPPTDKDLELVFYMTAQFSSHHE